jgi:peptide/nickel transport system substrate-binding protein
MLVKLQTFENFWLRTTSGEAMMTAYAGIFSAVPIPNTSPREFAPTMQGGLQWPKWGMYVASKGKQGEECDMPEARKLLDDVREWEHAADEVGRRSQPIVVGPKIRNVPKEGFYGWDPGGYIGLYQPDTFWVAP